MHNAPSVSYPVGRSRFAGLIASIVWLLAALVLALWVAQPGSWGWRQGLAFGALAASGGIAVWAWRDFESGVLQWDGQSWSWSSRTSTGSLHVVLDLQRWMLVQWRATGCSGTLWLWLERSMQPLRWADLRRAVYSRASHEAPFTADPPTANP